MNNVAKDDSCSKQNETEPPSARKVTRRPEPWRAYDVTSSTTPMNSSSTYVSFRNFSRLIFFCSLLPSTVATMANGMHMTMICTTSPVKCPCWNAMHA